MEEYLPRASAAYSEELCNGKFLAQKGLPDIGSSDATAGTDMHSAVATGDCSDLSVEQIATVEQAKENEDEIIREWANGENYAIFREVTLYSRNENGDKQYKGTPDIFCITANERRRCIIIDNKMLYGEHQSPVESRQLRRYLALIFENHHIWEALAHINQPKKKKAIPALYEFEDLQKSHEEMIGHIALVTNPNAQRVAGEIQCKFCRAKEICEEHKAWLASQSTSIVKSEYKIIPRDKQIDYYKKSKLLARMMYNHVKNFEKHVKENINNYPEFEIVESLGDRVITDPQKAKDALDNVIPEKDFMACVKIPIGKLEETYVKIKHEGGEKVKEAKKQFNALLGSAIQREKTKSLKLKGEK